MMRHKNGIALSLTLALGACSESVLFKDKNDCGNGSEACRDNSRPPFATPVPKTDKPAAAKSAMELVLDADQELVSPEPLEILFGADAIAQFNRDNGAFEVAASGQPKLNMSMALRWVSSRDEVQETLASAVVKLELYNKAKNKVLLSREFKSLGNFTLTGMGESDQMLGLIEADGVQLTVDAKRSAAATEEAAKSSPWTGTVKFTNERGDSSKVGTFTGLSD
jgi:hypothetical protein